MNAADSSGLAIVVSRDGAPVGTYGVEQDIVKIGRIASSHLRLDADGVSRMHAVIERQDEGWRIIDLGSAEGTFVGGKKVNTSPLAAGSVVRIGPFTLEVVAAPPQPQAAPEPQPSAPRRVWPCPSCGSTRPRMTAELHTQLSAPQLAFDDNAGLRRLRGEICRDCGHLGLFVPDPQSVLPR